MKRFSLILLILAPLAYSIDALASEQYVTDNLSVYLRRGPGSQYGLTGSLKAGDKVTILEKSEDAKYARIQDQRGRISWIEASVLTSIPSLKIRVPALEQKITQLKEKISNATRSQDELISQYTTKLEVANSQIAELQASNSTLQQQVKEQQEEIESLTNQTDQNRQDLMLKWFTRGGLIVGAGVILGLVVPYILPRRRKKDRWMN